MNTITRPELPPAPARIAALPVDERGYPVPYFVAWVDGKPEFRCADSLKFVQAVRDKLCWVCGQPHPKGFPMVFVLGPMCSINRVTAEPPCHKDCAEYSVKACPFLTKPHMVRREGNMPEETAPMPGLPILRNPGAVALWATRKYEPFDDGRGGRMFAIGGPEWVTWWAEGKLATRAQVLASVESGLPILRAEAMRQSPAAVAALAKMVEKAKAYLPRA